MQRCPTCDHDIDPAGHCQCFKTEVIKELEDLFSIRADRVAGRVYVAVRKEEFLKKMRVILRLPDLSVPDDTVEVSER